MKFRMRLILGYAILALAASFFLGIIYNYYLIQRYRVSIQNHIRFSSHQVLNTLEGELGKMEQVALQVLSDQDTVQAIRELSIKMETPKTYELDVNDAKAVVRDTLCTAYNLENFYRVVIFNQYGYIGASASMQEQMVNRETDVSQIAWLERVKGTKGRDVLIEPHTDDWAVPRNKRQVFSLVREIQGNQLGYIEVQQTMEYMAQVFLLPDERMKVLAIREDGELLYASEGIRASDYGQYYELENQVLDMENEHTGVRELISVQISQNYPVKLILVENLRDAMADNPSGWEAAFLIGSLFFIISLAFIVVMARVLTGPLQELRNRMETTQWSNLTDDIEIKSSDADIQALTGAYKNLMLRLQKSMEQEQRLKLLQLQAQFDTLQAQINPHFLYNVLNVISNRGMQNEDETICEICGHLASMLRYSTNTKTRYATIGEELHYMEEYCYLMKARYEDKILFQVEMDERIRTQIVPKMVLQQLVENCVNHGFANNTAQMRVWIGGYTFWDEKECDGKEKWYLQVRDNGQGFSQEALTELNEQMERTKRRLFQERGNMELEIGGMGLNNTYARLLLLYSDSLVFKFKNHPDGGAVVICGADMT